MNVIRISSIFLNFSSLIITGCTFSTDREMFCSNNDKTFIYHGDRGTTLSMREIRANSPKTSHLAFRSGAMQDESVRNLVSNDEIYYIENFALIYREIKDTKSFRETTCSKYVDGINVNFICKNTINNNIYNLDWNDEKGIFKFSVTFDDGVKEVFSAKGGRGVANIC